MSVTVSETVYNVIVDEVTQNVTISSSIGPTGPKGDAGEGVPAGGSTGQVLSKASADDYDTEWVTPSGGGSGAVTWGAIIGTLSSQTDLNTALSSKASATHSHAIADVTGLQTALDGKQAAGSYEASGTAAAALAAHEAASDPHPQYLTAAEGSAAYAALSHGHAIANVTGLQTALDSKEAAITAGTTGQYWRGDKSWQTLDKAAVGLGSVDNTSDASKPVSTAMQTALDGKASASHTHTASQVTDFAEAVDDRVAALLVAGTNITLTYSDAGDTLTIAASGGGGSPAGSDAQIQYNNAGSFGGAANAEIVSGNLTLANNTAAAAAAGKLAVFANTVAGRAMLHARGATNAAYQAQPCFGFNKVFMASAAGDGTTISSYSATLSATGTATFAGTALTNAHTVMRRLEYAVTVAATTAVAGFRGSFGTQFFMGTGSFGGFFFAARFGPARGCTNSSHRMFCGLLASTAAPTDVNPSTLTNMVGLGYDAADTQLQIMHNDGSGTATKVALGANFPKPTADNTDAYELVLFCPPAGTSVEYRVTNLTSGNVAAGTLSTNLPSGSTGLTPYGYTSVGGVSATTGISLSHIYIETDR